MQAPAPHRLAAALAAITLAATAAPASAQGGAAAPAAAASAPQQVEITGARQSDTEQRRQSTAAKIVIGREEIERFGDSTVGEVLKRLPGVTMPGPPGRGGGPRMRGLGAGYTQLLIDGQRVPPGFSIETLTPEQIERIEILRAPTAETGARAIGGTINIITREGFRRRLNDLRTGFGVENGQVTPGLFWTRNDSSGDLIYTLSGSAFRNRRSSASTTHTTDTDLDDGTLLRDQTEHSESLDIRRGLNMTSRLQWRLGGADSLILMPVVFHSRTDAERHFDLDQRQGLVPALYDKARSGIESSFTVGRLNLQYRATVDGGLRVELNGGASQARGRSDTRREEFDTVPTLLRTSRDRSLTRDRTTTLTGKLSKTLEGDHSLVGGAEIERLSRQETRFSEQDGENPLAEFDPELLASSTRLAAYLQDEWALSPHWAAHAGLRWESLHTRGDSADGSHPDNRSRVLTPLLHAVWKPDPKARDQIRMSLTRSYKSPTLQNLVARPLLSARYPAGVTNSATSPDRAGNPDLRPELATGIDIAFERYLPQGGVLSANLFHRRIVDYIRSTTQCEQVSWGPPPPADPGASDADVCAGRYVSRPKNLGRAITQGIELEAKFRLDQAFDGAPPTEVRSNLSLFRSRVAEVPGPDNRLDEQPKGTLNLGADHRFRGTPLTLGGSLNLTPGYRTRISELQSREAGRKRQFDAYALWVFNPAVQLRLLASNLSAADYQSAATVDTGSVRTEARTLTPSWTNWQLRLELKL